MKDAYSLQLQLRAGRLVRVNVPGQGFWSRPLCHRSLWECNIISLLLELRKHMF